MSDAQRVVASLQEKMRETGDFAQYRIHQLMQQPDKHCTDLGNARRFVNNFGDRIRYCDEMGAWFINADGKRYARDKSQYIRKLGCELPPSIYQEAADSLNENERKELAAWALQSESVSRQSAMISLAQPLVPVMVNELDADPMLFNVQNGTVDLRTGTLLPHDPSRIITKLAPVEYDPDAKCPIFLAFLGRIMDGNHALIEFLQRSIGYTATGSVHEEILIFLHGGGANGKSVLLNTLLSIFGDYGQPADPELLIAKRGEVHPAGVADLVGARLAVTNELEDGKRLAENLVKQLTGGDELKARFMHQNFFSFKPSHTLWMAGNHKPVIRGQDEGIWRRIRLVPFNVTIPPGEREPYLKEKLMNEAPGILNWIIEGCLKWHKDGLTYPDEVKAAVEEYREESDPIGDFFGEQCELKDNDYVASGELYRTYTTWCEENGQRPYSQKRLTGLITQRYPSVRKHNTGSQRVLLGLCLKATDALTHTDTKLVNSHAHIEKGYFTKTASESVKRQDTDEWESGEI